MSYLKDKKWALVLVAVFVVMAVRYAHRAEKRHAADFQCTYEAGKMFLEKRDIYGKFDDPTIAIYKYSPFIAMLALPLALLPLVGAAMVLFVLNFVFAVLIFVYGARLLVEDEADPLLKNPWLYLLPLFFTARLFLSVMDAGQVNILMVGLCVLGLHAMRKDRQALAAFLIVIAVMIKYTPFIFIPYFLFRGKWRFTLWCGFFAVLFCVAPMAVVGVSKGWEYLMGWFPLVVHSSLDLGSLAEFRNQSLLAMVLRYFSQGQYFLDRIALGNLTVAQGFALSAAISGLLYLWMLLPGKGRGGRNFSECVDYSLLLEGVALFNANSWAFNYMALVLGYMTLTYYFLKNGCREKWVPVGMGTAFLLSLGARGIVGEGLRDWSDILSLVTIGALILVGCLFNIKFGRPFPRQVRVVK